jgi:hypothetical protein
VVLRILNYLDVRAIEMPACDPGTYGFGSKACHDDKSLDAGIACTEHNVFEQRPAMQFDKRFRHSTRYGCESASVSGGEDQSEVSDC